MKIADCTTRLVAVAFAVAALQGAEVVRAQTQTQGQANRPGMDFDLLGDKDKSSTLSVVQPRGLALESVISPDRYYVGPSDGFSVSVWSIPPLTYQLTVTPEGTLIVPMVGEIRVAGLTLKAAREKTLEALRRTYLRNEVTMTLVTPRPLLVFVQGQVLNPGSYTMAA
ncbi:MAG TPA: polysaccharide biosynthesis/export family protein, partial [Bacteroidota bacterium]|nr:polysaccharide biosynthesis/export family protein [Bacteroidota bacterium]